MKKLINLFLFGIVLFTACKDRMVCAAFQSTYILDPDQQRNKFSFFDGDSLILTASSGNYKKDIYGMTERKYGYWKQQESLVVNQKDVYSTEVDSILNARKNKFTEAAESGVDSVIANPTIDSTQVASGADAWDNTKRFNYNVDFVNYMLLVGNDILIAQSAARDSAAARSQRGKSMNPTDSTENKSKGGFFNSLFNKRVKDPKTGTADGEEVNQESAQKLNQEPPQPNEPLQSQDDDF